MKYRNKFMFIIFSIIVLISIMLVFRINKNFKGPNAEELKSITFINIVDDIGIEKIVFDQQQDIEKLLEIFKTAEKVKGMESISDFPNKHNFTTILFNFKTGGSSIRSMYDENDNLYIDQPYDYIYKFRVDNEQILYQLIYSGKIESIYLNLGEIQKNNF